MVDKLDMSLAEIAAHDKKKHFNKGKPQRGGRGGHVGARGGRGGHTGRGGPVRRFNENRVEKRANLMKPKKTIGKKEVRPVQGGFKNNKPQQQQKRGFKVSNFSFHLKTSTRKSSLFESGF